MSFSRVWRAKQRHLGAASREVGMVLGQILVQYQMKAPSALSFSTISQYSTTFHAQFLALGVNWWKRGIKPKNKVCNRIKICCCHLIAEAPLCACDRAVYSALVYQGSASLILFNGHKTSAASEAALKTSLCLYRIQVNPTELKTDTWRELCSLHRRLFCA